MKTQKVNQLEVIKTEYDKLKEDYKKSINDFGLLKERFEAGNKITTDFGKIINEQSNIILQLRESSTETKAKIGMLECDLEAKRIYQRKIQEDYNQALFGLEMLQELNEDLEDEADSLFHGRNAWRVIAIGAIITIGILGGLLTYYIQ